MRSVVAVTCLMAVASTQAFLVPPSARPVSTTVLMAQQGPSNDRGVERKDVLSWGALSAAAVLGLMNAPGAAQAAEEVPVFRNSLGGLLEVYTDISKGFKMLKPSGWNEFIGSPETYVIKWADIVNQQDEIVILYSTPVKSSTTSVSALGEVKEVGEKLAKTRNSQLVSATDRVTDGLLFYEFVFKGEKTSEAFELVVARSRIWSLSCTASNKRFPKLEELYKGMLRGFLPKL